MIKTHVLLVFTEMERHVEVRPNMTHKRVKLAKMEDLITNARPDSLSQEVLVRKFFLSINYVLALFFFFFIFFFSPVLSVFSFAVVDLTPKKTEITTKKTHKVALRARHVQLEPTMRAPHALE